MRKLWATLHPGETKVLAMSSPAASAQQAAAPSTVAGPVAPALPMVAETEPTYGGPRLRFDKLQHRFWYGDLEVPTAPPASATKRRVRRKKGEPRPPRKAPSYVPPQQFNLLMILGAKNQGVMRAAELAERLDELGSLRKAGTTPELRNMKHRTCSILRSILCPLGVPKTELDSLLVLVPNVGLRLKAGAVEIIGWPEAGGPQAAPAAAQPVARRASGQ